MANVRSKNRKWKIWSLVYTEDVVEEVTELNDMMKKLKKYLDKKKMTLKVEKYKIVQGGKKNKWLFKRKEIEQAKKQLTPSRNMQRKE